MADVEASYEANTVEELREELRARDLPVSGHKEELIARLEEDDAAQETDAAPDQGLPGEGQAPDQGLPDEEAPAYPVVTYHPLELPANTAAAQAFIDAHPENVDYDRTLPDEQTALAQANIQDHVDQQAAMGITVEDPRLEGYEPPPPPEEVAPAELEEANA